MLEPPENGIELNMSARELHAVEPRGDSIIVRGLKEYEASKEKGQEGGVFGCRGFAVAKHGVEKPHRLLMLSGEPNL